MNKKIKYSLIVVGLALIVFVMMQGGESNEAYIERIEKERVEKNKFMRESSDSPFTSNINNLHDLAYFPVNTDFKVTAEIERINTRSYMQIGTSDGQSEKHYKFAYANFKIKGQPYRLLLLKPTENKDKKYIFTAFADDTSAETTYGGGRYLDLSFTNAQYVTIDFNQAYNPYCAYNPTYSCPLPPAENILNIAIEAGEQDYSK